MIPLTKRIRVTDAGRYAGESNDHNRATYNAVIEISIDMDRIVRTIGRKAVLNKTHRSRQGAVSVRAHSIEKIEIS